MSRYKRIVIEGTACQRDCVCVTKQGRRGPNIKANHVPMKRTSWTRGSCRCRREGSFVVLEDKEKHPDPSLACDAGSTGNSSRDNRATLQPWRWGSLPWRSAAWPAGRLVPEVKAGSVQRPSPEPGPAAREPQRRAHSNPTSDGSISKRSIRIPFTAGIPKEHCFWTLSASQSSLLSNLPRHSSCPPK